MKIAIVNDFLGSSRNGSVVAMQNLVNHLRGEGHEVRIICGDPSKKGVDGYYVTKARRFGPALDAYVKKCGVCIARCTRAVLKEAFDGVDYIHCMTPFALGAYAVRYAKAHNIPISAGFHMMAENVTAHVGLGRIKPINHAVYKVMYKRFFKKVDGIHYPTEFIKETFERHIGKSTPSYVVSNGADKAFRRKKTQKPKGLEDKIIITTTGRYSYEKAQEVLIEAVKYSKYRDRIQLILAGQGSKEKKYKRFAKKLPVKPIMRTFSRDEMAELLNYSDIYVHPARIELEGIACLEAVKCGAFTLVSDSPLSACKNFVSDKRCVFESGNAKELAWLIDYWLDCPDKMAEAKIANASCGVVYVDECMRKMDYMIADVMRRKGKGAEKSDADNQKSAGALICAESV